MAGRPETADRPADPRKGASSQTITVGPETLALGSALLVLAPAIVVLGFSVRAAPLGRAEVGHPVDGVAIVIDRSAPVDSVYHATRCGGVVVAPDLVLTAAHCVVRRPAAALGVIVDADGLCPGPSIGGTRTGIAAIVADSRYDARRGTYDLALLRLEDAVATRPRRIGSALDVRPGAPLTAIGWGSRSGLASSCRVTRVPLAAVAADECAELVGGAVARRVGRAAPRRFDTASMICARPRWDPREDTCHGDSGGPLLLGDDLIRAPVVGIVRWGLDCGSGIPGVYARADRAASNLPP